MRIWRSILALALFCSGVPGFGADANTKTLDEVLSKLDRSAAAFHGMTADLNETAHTAVIDEDQTQNGTIRMKRVKSGDTRMLVEFAPPDAKIVQLQGQTLSVYLPKLKTVDEYDVGTSKSLVDQFLLLGFGTTRADLEQANRIEYGGTEMIRGHEAARLVLTPKGSEALKHFQRIELWLSPDTGYPLQHKIYQPGGDYQLFVFDNLKMNPPDLTDSAMKLKLPKDVKVERPQQH